MAQSRTEQDHGEGASFLKSPPDSCSAKFHHMEHRCVCPAPPSYFLSKVYYVFKKYAVVIEKLTTKRRGIQN